MSGYLIAAERRLAELGPWTNRDELVDLGPQGLTQAWLGRIYSVQRYTVPSRPGWDRLHVQRHNAGARVGPSWRDWQALKLLLPNGDERLGIEVSPRCARVIDLAHAWHLWVLPLEDELERILDVAEELSANVPPAPWTELSPAELAERAEARFGLKVSS
jgi:hypothetical protein